MFLSHFVSMSSIYSMNIETSKRVTDNGYGPADIVTNFTIFLLPKEVIVRKVSHLPSQ